MKTFRGHSSPAIVALAMTLCFCFSRVGVLNAAQESKPPDTPAGNAENGKRIFNKIGCYQCHGREGQGSVMTGPRIAPNPVPFEVLAALRPQAHGRDAAVYRQGRIGPGTG